MDETFAESLKLENKIYFIRNTKVMLDFDLAQLYGVENKYLKRSVRRNHQRFPSDFMFPSSNHELENWRFQFGTSNPGVIMGLRVTPFAFTELGIAMLSSVLNYEKAISVNIQIMRTFALLKKSFDSNDQLRTKVEELEKKYDHNFSIVFEAIKKLIDMPVGEKRKIGFGREDE
jgi:hypothetical protein